MFSRSARGFCFVSYCTKYYMYQRVCGCKNLTLTRSFHRGGRCFKLEDGTSEMSKTKSVHDTKVKHVNRHSDGHLAPVSEAVDSQHAKFSDNYFDQQYFSQISETESQHGLGRLEDDIRASSHINRKIDCDDDGHIFDEQYFSALKISDQNKSGNGGVIDQTVPADFSLRNSRESQDDSQEALLNDSQNFFDDQYFGNTVNKSTTKSTFNLLDLNVQKRYVHTDNQHFFDDQYFKNSTADKKKENVIRSHEILDEDNQNYISSSSEQTSDKGDIVIMGLTKMNKKSNRLPKANLDDPQTAYDMAMKIRSENRMSDNNISPHMSKWSGETDSKGFRILKNQTLNLEYLTNAQVVQILKDSIIYEDDKLVAIDKPYDLPSHGGPGVHHSVGKYLGELGQICNKGIDLHLVHRLDKATTGVMLLAKNNEAYIELRGYFKRQIVKKIYWAITKGVPNPIDGIIDIPMAETTVKGKVRMGLRPHYSEETKPLMKKAKSVKKFPAVTEYSVLDQSGTAAIVECRPQTGVKHQIRCHLAYGLNCPVLGDHKYSHFSKLAPQKLNPDMLQRLQVRQAKVRHIPMHLHARSLILPEYKDGRNIFISARLPKHFVQNMKWLKLKPPKL